MRGPLLGRGQVGICQRSGKKLQRKTMVEDGQVKGLLVAPEWWEPYQPLLLPPPMRPDGLPKQRPAPDDSTGTTAGALSVSVTGTTASLTWTAASNNETLIDSYNVWRSTDSAAAVLLGSVNVEQVIVIENDVDGTWSQTFVYEQPYDDYTLETGHTYTYYVQAIPFYGGQPVNTNSVTVSPAAPGLTTFIFDTGAHSFVSGPAYGFSDGNIETAFGSLVSGGAVDGGTLSFFYGSTDTSTGELAIGIGIIGNIDAPPVDLFNEVSFTDAQGNAATLYTANAGAGSTYPNGSGFLGVEYTVVGNIAFWNWNWSGHTNAEMFTTSDDYEVTVS